MLLVNFLSLFLQCRDTFMIEAFHNVILVYAPKRNHFGNEMFTCRLNLAVIDWVSNCFIQCTMPVNLFVYIQPPIHHSTHILFMLLYLFVYLFTCFIKMRWILIHIRSQKNYKCLLFLWLVEFECNERVLQLAALPEHQKTK